MFNYISSYWQSSPQPKEDDQVDHKGKSNFNIEEGPTQGYEIERGDELRQYDRERQKDLLKQSSSGNAQAQSSSQGGLLNKLYTRMSGHPNCDVILDHYEGRTFFTAGDDLKGKIRIKTVVEGQLIKHQGVKISLLGMILQIPQHVSYQNSQGMVIKLDQNRAAITAQNITKYKQYTFMQIQKQIEYSGEFCNLKEIEFNFKNLEEELRDHETYNGIDNFIKYFLKIQMTYTGGSMIAGNNLEVLHEVIVKNNYSLMHAKKKREEQKAQQSQSEKGAVSLQKGSSGDLDFSTDKAGAQPAADMGKAEQPVSGFAAEEENLESESVTLDQTFMSNASLEGMNTSGPKNTAGLPFDQSYQASQPNLQKNPIESSVPTNVLGSRPDANDDDEGDPLSGAF